MARGLVFIPQKVKHSRGRKRVFAHDLVEAHLVDGKLHLDAKCGQEIAIDNPAEFVTWLAWAIGQRSDK